MVATRSTSSGKPPKAKKPGFFSKLKKVFGSNTNSSITSGASSSQQSRRPSSVTSEATSNDRLGLGLIATRTRSRRSFIFGGGGRDSHKEAQSAEAALEERKAKCMAIKLAKRDPPAVQRLLVDCEFCNPPPKFGRFMETPSPGYTSKDTRKQLAHMKQLPEPLTEKNEEEWNVGLHEWREMRRKWLTPTSEAQEIHHLEPELTSDRYYTVYDKLIYQTRPFKHPLNLGDLVQILKAGWIGEGAWPEGDDADVWSTDEAEEPGNEEDVSSDEDAESQANGAGSNQQGASVHSGTGRAAPFAGSTSPSASTHTSSVSGIASTPAIHVQFSDRPHPRVESSRPTMAPLSRVQSSLGGTSLRPVRSSQSSIVSITDSD